MSLYSFLRLFKCIKWVYLCHERNNLHTKEVNIMKLKSCYLLCESCENLKWYSEMETLLWSALYNGLTYFRFQFWKHMVKWMFGYIRSSCSKFNKNFLKCRADFIAWEENIVQGQRQKGKKKYKGTIMFKKNCNLKKCRSAEHCEVQLTLATSRQVFS